VDIFYQERKYEEVGRAVIGRGVKEYLDQRRVPIHPNAQKIEKQHHVPVQLLRSVEQNKTQLRIYDNYYIL